MSAFLSTAEYLDLEELADVIIARPYLRVSKDESGRLRSNREQYDDAVTICARKRWELGAAYEDEGSASIFRAKERLDFARLMADIRSGDFGAHVLVLWEASRGSREVPEWWALLHACQVARVFIFVTSERRLFNPSICRDWKALMDAAVDAEYESRRSSERIRRSTKADAAAGSFTGGRRPYGFQKDGVTHNPAEAPVIQEAARLLLGGKSVRWIAGHLTELGLLTSTGKPWHPGPLGKLLASQRVAGHRVHDGVVVKRDAWPAILDAETHARVAAVLATRSPEGRRGRTAWLLSAGLLRCGKVLTVRGGLRGVSVREHGPTERRPPVRLPGRDRVLPGAAGWASACSNRWRTSPSASPTERLVDQAARHAAHVTVSDEAERLELDRITATRARIAVELTEGKMEREDAGCWSGRR